MPETLPIETPQVVPPVSATPPSTTLTESPSSPLAKGFFFFFVAGLVVFLPFGMWITQDIKQEKAAQENIWNPTLPMNDAELNKMRQTNQLPPPQATDQWQMNPNANQPTAAPMPPQAAMPQQPTDPTYNPNTGRSYADYSGRNAAISVIQDQLKWTSWNIRDCLAMGGAVTSGSSGTAFCSAQPAYIFNPISYCGPNPTDTIYTAMRTNSDNWDVTITCTNYPECNGPQNALCKSSGCTFANDCQKK